MKTDYRGMSYKAASMEGMRLLQEAVRTGRWHALPEKLSQLREIMFQHVEAGADKERVASR